MQKPYMNGRNHEGERFHAISVGARLDPVVLVGYVSPSRTRQRMYLGVCDCGNKMILAAADMGVLESCGCKLPPKVFQARSAARRERELKFFTEVFDESKHLLRGA